MNRICHFFLVEHVIVDDDAIGMTELLGVFGVCDGPPVRLCDRSESGHGFRDSICMEGTDRIVINECGINGYPSRLHRYAGGKANC